MSGSDWIAGLSDNSIASLFRFRKSKQSDELPFQGNASNLAMMESPRSLVIGAKNAIVNAEEAYH